ncbi:hypothetical protein [Paenibacillus larvae]|nr:hypothetical protein [Paenibacillus larvae]
MLSKTIGGVRTDVKAEKEFDLSLIGKAIEAGTLKMEVVWERDE